MPVSDSAWCKRQGGMLPLSPHLALAPQITVVSPGSEQAPRRTITTLLVGALQPPPAPTTGKEPQKNRADDPHFKPQRGNKVGGITGLGDEGERQAWGSATLATHLPVHTHTTEVGPGCSENECREWIPNHESQITSSTSAVRECVSVTRHALHVCGMYEYASNSPGLGSDGSVGYAWIGEVNVLSPCYPIQSISSSGRSPEYLAPRTPVIVNHAVESSSSRIRCLKKIYLNNKDPASYSDAWLAWGLYTVEGRCFALLVDKTGGDQRTASGTTTLHVELRSFAVMGWTGLDWTREQLLVWECGSSYSEPIMHTTAYIAGGKAWQRARGRFEEDE
ncbi:hypothetical protein B0T17DRAFT_502521 [Bombardia bombarda]|uniref:Uncharacterized protein n=1 Tax=Bombardia bombarda TaxID=252184 RepID=A0AA40CEY1_9PEZI|nr:hypothetical protein B0T17DRAFT_502521 [Bombardia bombarda]